MASKVTITLDIDDAQDLRELLLFRPHDELWSDRVLAAVRAGLDGAGEQDYARYANDPDVFSVRVDA